MPDNKEIVEMNLFELEVLTSGRAAEKGFSQAELIDDHILELPVALACMELQAMAALEKHRKSQDGSRIEFEHPAMMEAMTLARFDMAKDGALERLTPQKKYLITKLLLISSEVAEAIEAILELGTDNPKTSQTMVTEEIADVVIRAVGLKNELEAAYPGAAVSVAKAVAEKIEYNNSRPKKHGNKHY
jgi:NTP pyrophosphatase (non-canonical NTP hydrolase)